MQDQNQEDSKLIEAAADRLVDRMLQDPKMEEKILRKIAARFCGQENRELKTLLRSVQSHKSVLVNEARDQLTSERDEFMGPMVADLRKRLVREADKVDCCSPEHIRKAMDKTLSDVTKKRVEAIVTEQVRTALVNKMKSGKGSIQVTVELTGEDFSRRAHHWTDDYDY